MQDEILTTYVERDVQVYTVWLPILPGDARGEWDAGLLADGRVTHFWDGERVAGRWFAENSPTNLPIAWDIYFLYGPDAVWEDIPTPLVSYGSTVLAKREQLRSDLFALWQQIEPSD